MAAAASDHHPPLEQSSSLNILPPIMSELRIILLGSSWSERSSVGNFILGETVFNKAPERSERISGTLEGNKIAVINTPDLLHPNITQDELTEHVKYCVCLSDPGPHVFLLVLQPEEFTVQQREKLYSVLQLFSDRSFDHSLVLLSIPRKESPGLTEKYMERPPLKDMIRKCRYRHLRRKNLDRLELLTRLGQVVKENNGDHVSNEAFEDEEAALPDDQQSPKQKKIPTGTTGAASALRIVLLGKSEEKQTKLGNFINNHQGFRFQTLSPTKQCVATCGEWKGNPVTVVKTPDMFSLSEEKLKREVKSCVTLCHPGPNVLLLLVKPSDFTEENRQTLKVILSLFGQDAFQYTMVIMTHNEEQENNVVNKLIQYCKQRQHRINLDKKDRQELMQKIENVASDNRGRYLKSAEEAGLVTECNHPKPSLNLVLCGRRGAGKTSAAKAILGQTDLHSVSNASECVKHQGEVCGRWVSLVELPAFYGKPPEAVMEESLRCISLCNPVGVHAFILVLRVDPLTDEDKAELKAIQNTFSSRVNHFTMILFTVESDPTAPSVVNFVKDNKEIQELCRSSGGRYFVLNIKDKLQIPELLEAVDKIRPNKDEPCCYTTGIFAKAKLDQIIQQEERITRLEAELNNLETASKASCDDQQQSPESLRIVLIGKTGSGKSSSGNTILGDRKFKAATAQTSVTKCCQKAKSEVDGRHVVVVDTPGMFDTTLTHEEVNEEMVKCISLLAPGPHVFLLVLPIGRLTAMEKDTLKLMREKFGRTSEKFTIILFTRGDSLVNDEISIKKYIEDKCDHSFKKLIADCGGRYHVFNNHDKHNHNKVSDLIAKIDTMVKENGGSHYTNEMLQEAEAAIKKEMERILKENEEMQREREELKQKHMKEMEAMRRRVEDQRSEIENKSKQREELLKEMEENITKEREERKKEQDIKEEEERKRKQQEENQQQERKREVEAWEQKIRSESDSKETIDRKLKECREQMRKQQEEDVKKQNEWWDQRKQEDEKRQVEQERFRKLEEEYKQEKEKYEYERKYDQIRREREEKERKKLEEKYKEELERMEKRYEEEARKKAEEFNEFRERKDKDFAAQIENHMKEVKDMKQKQEKDMQEKQEEYERLNVLSTHKEKSSKQEMDELQNNHTQEMADLVLILLTQKNDNRKKIKSMLKTHTKEVDKHRKDLSAQTKKKETEEMDKITKKHDQEMKALDMTQNKEDQKMKKDELSVKHHKQIGELRQNLLDKEKENHKEEMDELQKQHERKLDEFKQKLLKEMDKKQKEKLDEMQKKHEKEVKQLKEQCMSKDEDVHEKKELEELQKKHEKERKELKEKLLFPDEKGPCSIS